MSLRRCDPPELGEKKSASHEALSVVQSAGEFVK